MLVTVAEHDAATISATLARHDINAPAGSCYACEPTRLPGLGTAGGLRIGLAPYNNDDDVDGLIRTLADTLRRR